MLNWQSPKEGGADVGEGQVATQAEASDGIIAELAVRAESGGGGERGVECAWCCIEGGGASRGPR